jgi:hypothetical protein
MVSFVLPLRSLRTVDPLPFLTVHVTAISPSEPSDRDKNTTPREADKQVINRVHGASSLFS